MSLVQKMYSVFPRFLRRVWRTVKYQSYEKYTDDEKGFILCKKSLFGKKGFHSQYGQDYFMKTLFFSDIQDGVFCDIGGNHPEIYNNTLAFEREGWTGIAFEPQPQMNQLWKNQRKTECFPYAIGDEDKTISFVEEGSGSEAMLSHVGKDGDSQGHAYKVQQRRLDKIFEERHISRIDFMSCDVEGYELNVLKGIDFTKVNIRYVLIENDETEVKKTRQVRKYLAKNGFILIARLTQDDVWMNSRM